MAKRKKEKKHSIKHYSKLSVASATWGGLHPEDAKTLAQTVAKTITMTLIERGECVIDGIGKFIIDLKYEPRKDPMDRELIVRFEFLDGYQADLLSLCEDHRFKIANQIARGLNFEEVKKQTKQQDVIRKARLNTERLKLPDKPLTTTGES